MHIDENTFCTNFDVIYNCTTSYDNIEIKTMDYTAKFYGSYSRSCLNIFTIMFSLCFLLHNSMLYYRPLRISYELS